MATHFISRSIEHRQADQIEYPKHYEGKTDESDIGIQQEVLRYVELHADKGKYCGDEDLEEF